MLKSTDTLIHEIKNSIKLIIRFRLFFVVIVFFMFVICIPVMRKIV